MLYWLTQRYLVLELNSVSFLLCIVKTPQTSLASKAALMKNSEVIVLEIVLVIDLESPVQLTVLLGFAAELFQWHKIYLLL